MNLSVKEISEARSEEVQDIIERMPSKFGFWVTSIVISLLLLIFSFGWIIQYPDTVTGQITINAKFSPVKMVAASSGKITLLKNKTTQSVQEGEYIAVIQNPTNLNDIRNIKKLLSEFDLAKIDYQKMYSEFPNNVSLGEVNNKYYAFLSVLHRVNSNAIGSSFKKQQEGLEDQISKLTKLLSNFRQLESTREKNMNLYQKMLSRDSLLLSRGGTVEAELDQTRASFLNSKAGYQNITNEINSIEQRLSENTNRLQLLQIQKSEEDNKLRLDLLSSYDELKDIIKLWEERYVFKAPVKGELDFLKFWINNQFVQAGEEMFSVIPKDNKIIGQVSLPTQGTGKVKVGQDVIIKLDNYPFQEFGSVKGKVSNISLTINSARLENKPNVDVYLVEVDLPDRLRTNYGEVLDFKSEIKGTAEIIANKRNLLERFFDTLRHASSKTK